MKILARLLLMGVMLLSWSGVTHQPVQAQGQSTKPIDLILTPPVQYLQVEPGKSASHKLVLTQQGSLPLQVTPSLVDFESDGLTGQPRLKWQEGTTFRHMTITNPELAFGQSFTLLPGQKKTINLNINPPPDATQGEYPLTVLFSAQADKQATLIEGSPVSGVIGSNLVVLISATDQDRGKLTIEEIRVPRFVDSFSALTFQVLAANEGKNATTASGSATVSDWRQQTVSEYELYPDMVLADSQRLLRTGSELETDSNDRITSDFAYKPAFLLGPYTIAVNLAANGQATTDFSEYSVTVYAFPFSLLALVVIGLCLVAALKYITAKDPNHSR